MKNKFKKVPNPIPDRVLVLPEPFKTKSESGILLVTKEEPKTTRGTVLSVGKDNKNYDSLGLLQPGVKVMFGDWAGVPFVYEGIKMLSMRIVDIFGVLE